MVVGDDEHRRPHREVHGRTAMMHDRGKSDSLVVPKKPPNNAGQPATEVVEGSGLAKGTRPGVTTTGHSAGSTRRLAPSEYVRQQGRIGNSGSPRCCTTSTMSTVCGRRISP